MVMLNALKLMFLYLIEIGIRLRRFLKYWFLRFITLFPKEVLFVLFSKKAEQQTRDHSYVCRDLERKCAFLEEQKRAVDAKVETYRVLKRRWKKLLTGMDYTVRSSRNTNQMTENSITFLVSARRLIVLAQKDFDGSRRAVERYEKTMRYLMDILEQSGLVQLFPTDDMPGMSRVNVPLFHIALLREEVFFLQKLLEPRAQRLEYGSPSTWEEMMARYKEAHQA